MDAIAWPERPTCHDNDYQANQFGQTTWIASEGFRVCSYCGSLHPEDAYNALRNGAVASQSDWKYGWPHKFYLDKIPNPHAGRPIQLMSSSGPGEMPLSIRSSLDRQAEALKGTLVVNPRTDELGRVTGYNAAIFGPGPALTTGKHYNVHLQDLSPEAFDALAPLLSAGTGVTFSRDENGVKFSGAPYGG